MSSHELDPFVVEKRDPIMKEVLNEKEPSREQKLEILRPRAFEIVKAHQGRVVPKVEELLSLHKSFDKFPKAEVEKLAYFFGDQTEMIELIAQAIEEGKGK